MLNAFVKHTIEQNCVWWFPGGRYKKFISNNSDLILSWNYDKGLLSFHGKTGDRFMDICTSKRSPLLNTCSLRPALDAASATVSNSNNFLLCVEQNDQNDSPNSKSISPQPSCNPSTLEELQNFTDESFQCLSSQKRNSMPSAQIIDESFQCLSSQK